MLSLSSFYIENFFHMLPEIPSRFFLEQAHFYYYFNLNLPKRNSILGIYILVQN